MEASIKTILVLNAGSSSLKVELFDFDSGQSIESETMRVNSLSDLQASAKLAVSQLQSSGALAGLKAIGHRVVHGGSLFKRSTLIDSSVKAALEDLCDLAPLHNPNALAAIEAIGSAFPKLPQIAVFDTAFFANLPISEQVYALPFEWFESLGIRRFGFHGISHSYCSKRCTEILNTNRNDLKLIVCHLGNGCSASAVKGGKAVATTMGFTPMEGLMMGGRSGSIDPGILFHLLKRNQHSIPDLEKMLNFESGLKGVSGVSSDFREVQKAADAGVERARLAIDLFSNKIRGSIGALAVGMGGVDALVFTGGIGENSPRLRQKVCEGLEFIGCCLDDHRNDECHTDSDLSDAKSSVRILVVQSKENLEIANETIALLAPAR